LGGEATSICLRCLDFSVLLDIAGGGDSVFAVALGAQYELTDRVALRMGYLANENPIPDIATLFNVQLPTINQHQISVGGGGC
jgi:hypothetical protein